LAFVLFLFAIFTLCLIYGLLFGILFALLFGLLLALLLGLLFGLLFGLLLALLLALLYLCFLLCLRFILTERVDIRPLASATRMLRLDVSDHGWSERRRRTNV